MNKTARHGWLTIAPPFSADDDSHNLLLQHVARLSAWMERKSSDHNDLALIREESLDKIEGNVIKPSLLKAAMNLLTDLIGQKWGIRVTEDDKIEVCQPDVNHLNPMAEKARIRDQEIIKRNEQLKQPAVQQFVTMMERRRYHEGRFVSIFSLMRDGRDLSASLRAVRDTPVPDRLKALRNIVEPYLQFVAEDAVCEQTGFRLHDIWRYFRHTWSNQYTSTPGRTMAFLVRDRAAPFHPIIGIGALASPIVQIKERDEKIGWHPDVYLKRLREKPSARDGEWLIRIVNRAIDEIFVEDFFQETNGDECLLTPQQIANPSKEVIKRVVAYGERQRILHHRFSDARSLKQLGKRQTGECSLEYWERRAKSHLFRSKRALLLSEMLWAKVVLKEMVGDSPSAEDVRQLTFDGEGQRVIKRVLRKAKADRVGISMADITVCGAIAPYNPVLGGKLVSMLAASPEVIEAYERRYRETESEIASSMAGRPIVRPSTLVFLGTTSLYGVCSSQYNRVRVPANRLGGSDNEEIRFIEYGRSKAFGTSQFSDATVKDLVAIVQQSSNGQRVNSIFGEGVSPKLRKVRDGLDLMSLPTEELLQHGRHRIIYGIPLVRNLHEYLIGMDDQPDFVFSCKGKEATRIVSDWWLERWLSKRIERDDALERVAANHLTYPVRHGARVELPKTKFDDKQLSLFDDLDY